MSTLAKDIKIVRELRDRPRPTPPAYDAERREQLRHKYAADPGERFLDEKDVQADDAGVPRFGDI